MSMRAKEAQYSLGDWDFQQGVNKVNKTGSIDTSQKYPLLNSESGGPRGLE